MTETNEKVEPKPIDGLCNAGEILAFQGGNFAE